MTTYFQMRKWGLRGNGDSERLGSSCKVHLVSAEGWQSDLNSGRAGAEPELRLL